MCFCVFSVCTHAGAANPAGNKHILTISTGPDHPASYDSILADAITDIRLEGEKTFMNTYKCVYAVILTIYVT